MNDVANDWVFTRYGKLFHVARPKRQDETQWHTYCGRFASENADDPAAWWGGRSCIVCTHAATGRPSAMPKNER